MLLIDAGKPLYSCTLSYQNISYWKEGWVILPVNGHLTLLITMKQLSLVNVQKHWAYIIYLSYPWDEPRLELTKLTKKHRVSSQIKNFSCMQSSGTHAPLFTLIQAAVDLLSEEIKLTYEYFITILEIV